MTSNPDSTSENRIVGGRPAVPALDEVIGRKWSVLDDGFIRVVDYLGGDKSIVEAARVSYGEGTRRLQKDQGLIRYLMRHGHTTPFEMCEIKFHLRVPMDTWRQWIRHRTANVNEYSTRYSVAIDRAQTTLPNEWRRQAKGNRQGSEGTLELGVGQRLTNEEGELQAYARRVYEGRLSLGVAREQARKDLPLSTYTESFWKIDLWNLFHFLSLRLDPSAQDEIRSYARIIGYEIVARWVPLAWQAFLDYSVNAVRFTAPELQVLKALISKGLQGAKQAAMDIGWAEKDSGGKQQRNRERDELVEKIARRFSIDLGW